MISPDCLRSEEQFLVPQWLHLWAFMAPFLSPHDKSRILLGEGWPARTAISKHLRTCDVCTWSIRNHSFLQAIFGGRSGCESVYYRTTLHQPALHRRLRCSMHRTWCSALQASPPSPGAVALAYSPARTTGSKKVKRSYRSSKDF